MVTIAALNFGAAYSALLEQEGGYNNLAEDRGGATNYGISLRFIESLPLEQGDITGDGHVNLEDIRALDEEVAGAFYQAHFWEHYKLSQVVSTQVSVKLFGMFVNMRGQVAARACQRALRACGYPVREDGILGRKSFTAINECNDQVLVAALKSEQAAVYRRIVRADPSQRIFLTGWLNRAYDSDV